MALGVPGASEDQGAETKGKINPNRQVVAGCQERAQATKAIVHFFAMTEWMSCRRISHTRLTAAFPFKLLHSVKRENLTEHWIYFWFSSWWKNESKKEVSKKPGKPKHFPGETSRWYCVSWISFCETSRRNRWTKLGFWKACNIIVRLYENF